MQHFPFSAIVGLASAKRSLIYQAIDPRIGGTLLLGKPGCAKRTLAQAFASVLPRNECGDTATFIEAPHDVSGERLLGFTDPGHAHDVEKWQARAGLLEQADGGVLYIDGIHLLPGQLVGLILDAAAAGQYPIERDGLARSAKSSFIFIASMDPDSGILSPKLTDRFAHGVRVSGDHTTEERVEIARRRALLESDNISFNKSFAGAEEEMRRCIRAARMRLHAMTISDADRAAVSERAQTLRLEIAVLRTARAAAAWAGRPGITADDFAEAWTLCLGHRATDTQGASSPA